jgi:hypothetical protein
MVGATGVPQDSNINGCDSFEAPKNPAEVAANPRHCRTYESFIEMSPTARLGGAGGPNAKFASGLLIISRHGQ